MVPHPGGVSRGDKGPGKHHAGAPGRGSGGRHGVNCLGHGYRLASQRSLRCLQVRCPHQPDVRHNGVPGLQHDNIPGHQVAGRNAVFGAVANHPDHDFRPVAQRRHGTLGTALMPRANQRVHDHHRDDGDCVGSVPKGQRNAGRDSQQQDQGAAERTEETCERTGSGWFGKGVGPMDSPGSLHRGFVKACRRIDSEALKHIMRSQRVPCGRRLQPASAYNTPRVGISGCFPSGHGTNLSPNLNRNIHSRAELFDGATLIPRTSGRSRGATHFP